MPMFRTCIVLFSLTVAAPAAADRPTIQHAAHVEAARLAGLDAAARAKQGTAPARSRNWVQRHPVLTGTLIGAGTGFLIGYLPGDDGVFYDYTAGFNGTVLAGVGAGAGASIVAIVQAVRR
jgi:hypothetical protein